MKILTPQRKYLFKLKKYLPKFLRPKKQFQNKKKPGKDAPKSTAFLIAYCGKNYYGVNFNWEVPTIEKTLLIHLHELGLTPPLEQGVRTRVNLQRVSRTDKGVSAASNVIQLKMPHNQTDVIQRLNGSLPADIKVIDIKRCPHDFQDHKECISRTYSYTLPTLALAPMEEIVTTDYRVSLDTIERVNEILEKFHGRHSFHNFTRHKVTLVKDPARFVYDFECGMPFVKDGMEFCEMRIKGSSFMMHQIRKMIGLTIAIARGFCDDDVIDLCWQDLKVDIPKAPGLGLVLEKLFFHPSADIFFGKNTKEENRSDNLAKILEFRSQHIIPDILNTELEQNEMMKWLNILPFHKYHEVRLNGMDNWSLRKLMRNLHFEEINDEVSDTEGAIVDIEDDDHDDIKASNKDIKDREETVKTDDSCDKDSIDIVDEERYEPKREKVRQQTG